jgi:hypothetical protein
MALAGQMKNVASNNTKEKNGIRYKMTIIEINHNIEELIFQIRTI